MQTSLSWSYRSTMCAPTEFSALIKQIEEKQQLKKKAWLLGDFMMGRMTSTVLHNLMFSTYFFEVFCSFATTKVYV